MANAVVKLTASRLRRWIDLEIGADRSDEADRMRLVPSPWSEPATTGIRQDKVTRGRARHATTWRAPPGGVSAGGHGGRAWRRWKR